MPFMRHTRTRTKKSVQTYAFLEKSWNLLTHTTKLWKKKDSFRDNDLDMKSHRDARLSSRPISASLCGQLWPSLFRGEQGLQELQTHPNNTWLERKRRFSLQVHLLRSKRKTLTSQLESGTYLSLLFILFGCSSFCLLCETFPELSNNSQLYAYF